MTEETAAQQPQEPDAPPQQSAEPESSPKDSPEESAPQKDRTQRRIDQLVARMSQAEQRADKAEAELEALRKRDEPEPPARPQRSEFDDAEAFAEAVADWTDQRLAFADQQREAAEERKRKVAEEQEAQQRLTEKQQKTLEWLSGSDISDFFEVVTRAPICTQAMLDVAESMEDGYKVLYELVQDKAAAEKIAGLDGNRVAIEMMKRSQPKPGTSQAPEPPTPVTGGGDTADKGDLRDDLPMDEWAKRFRDGRAKRRRA